MTKEDYEAIMNHLRGKQILTGDALERADVNGDGKITMADYGYVVTIVKNG